MTEGSILGHLIRFSLPLLLGNLFQQLYNTVDSIVVGNFVSKEALAAVGSTGSIINMVVSMMSGLSIGATVVIAQYYGARDHKNLHDAVHTTMLATLISQHGVYRRRRGAGGADASFHAHAGRRIWRSVDISYDLLPRPAGIACL